MHSGPQLAPWLLFASSPTFIDLNPFTDWNISFKPASSGKLLHDERHNLPEILRNITVISSI
ncbi:MAG TPA: hypothetical protein VFW07_08365 [Parafilimonas sp.]|nr:hypothetical protein [Parafilimonas sp.]